jgi:serine/threonine-protein kinase
MLLLDAAEPQSPVCGRIVRSGQLAVGRDRASEVRLPEDDRDAHRQHFVVRLTPAFCRLTNKGQRGTFVNGMEVKTECDLRHGDLVRAGRTTFHVEIRRGGAPAELLPSPTAVMPPPDATSPVPPPPPSVQSQTLERVASYRVLRLLGRGGMGFVYLAEDPAGRQVACKVMRSDLALDPENCARFRREAEQLEDLNHRHVVGFREAGEFNGSLYLVMEYVAGRNLAELLREQGEFDYRRAVRLTCQLLEALGAAHGNGVVHRDVKPSNVLIHNGPDGEEVRLADFGLAKPYQTGNGAALTQPGTRGGTVAFSAPEMIVDFLRANPLADQYGAAATLYNLLTNSLTHDARNDNAIELLDKIRNEDAVPLSRRRPGLPEGLVGAIHRALDREPRSRFGTVLAFRDALAPYAVTGLPCR